MSPIQRQICLGAILGDSGIDLSRAGSASLRMQHCNAQIEYLEWKKDLLQNFFVRDKPTICKPTGFSRNPSYLYQSVTHQEFQSLNDLFYPPRIDGKRRKSLNAKIFDELGLEGVLIWFLDDGCITVSQIRLHTNCFTIEEHELIIAFFKKKFDIDVKTYFLKSQNQLITIFLKKEAEKLLRLFSLMRLPIPVPNCMRYKFSFH